MSLIFTSVSAAITLGFDISLALHGVNAAVLLSFIAVSLVPYPFLLRATFAAVIVRRDDLIVRNVLATHRLPIADVRCVEKGKDSYLAFGYAALIRCRDGRAIKAFGIQESARNLASRRTDTPYQLLVNELNERILTKQRVYLDAERN